MTRLRRFGGAVTIAALLAAGTAMTAVPASAGTRGATATNVAAFCSSLGDYIARLEAMPAGPLRDFLLRIARSLYSHYCA